jgi:hypothetical protein
MTSLKYCYAIYLKKLWATTETSVTICSIQISAKYIPSLLPLKKPALLKINKRIKFFVVYITSSSAKLFGFLNQLLGCG